MQLAVLISGRGSNLEAIVKASQSDPLSYPEVCLVISNNPYARGLYLDCLGSIPTFVADSSDDFVCECQIMSAIESHFITHIALAGFMKVLSPMFCREYEGRMLNIHPSILPKYKGLNTHKRAIESGEKIHGCSVHYVTKELDSGPVIAQSTITIEENDTPETLASRLLAKEHNLYPKVLSLIYSEELKYRWGDIYFRGNLLSNPLVF